MLQSQGFGSRKESIKLIRKGRLTVEGIPLLNPRELLDLTALRFEVDGTQWEYHHQLYIAYHKPIGLECSRSPEHNPSIFDELPFPFMARDLQPAGRLDLETDGLLFLSDNGQFIHRMISPKQAIARRYRVTARHPLTDPDLERLRNGVELRNEEGLFTAFDIERIGEREVRFSIDRGVYHQVRRMVAALSNRLETLTREEIGGVGLGDLQPGEWRHLTTQELQTLGWEP